MQELFLIKNRRHVTRLTAMGGFALGVLVSMGICTLAVYFFSASETGVAVRNERVPAHRSEDSARNTNLLLQDQLLRLQSSLSDIPIKALARNADRNAEQALHLLEQMPPFKSDVYRYPFAALRIELQRQRSEAQALSTALAQGRHDGDPSLACRLAGPVSGSPLWASGALALYSQGWKEGTP